MYFMCTFVYNLVQNHANKYSHEGWLERRIGVVRKGQRMVDVRGREEDKLQVQEDISVEGGISHYYFECVESRHVLLMRFYIFLHVLTTVEVH